MNEPRIEDIVEKLEDKYRELERLYPNWSSTSFDPRSLDRYYRDHLGDVGPYRYAIFREMENPESRLWALKRQQDAEGMKVAEFLTTKINGRPPFHIEFNPARNSEASRALLQALNGPPKPPGKHEVAKELGVQF